MLFNNKTVLVVGVARTGISTADYLLKNGATVILNDSKNKEELKDVLDNFSNKDNIEFILGRNPSFHELEKIDFAVVSPGVPLDLDYILELKKVKKEVISEIELAFRASRQKNMDFIGITGTNGKTTTTSIVGEIFKASGKETYIVGNIGNPSIHAVDIGGEKSVLVTELSSFQLESIEEFKPKVSTVLNLTEDHLNRHHTMENYTNAKARIFINQNVEDFCILNYDDEITKKMAENCKASVRFFSRKNKVENGIYLNEKNEIIINDKGVESVFMKADQLSLPGAHNLENCMAAIGMCISYGIDKGVIKNVLKNFKAVEHRLEYVDTVNGIKFVNDSKGTNPDSTIKAVQSYNEPIILIAGGYDKGSDFNELFEIAKKYVRTVIVLGQTAELIEKTAKNNGIEEIYKVNSMSEAVQKSFEVASENNVVLLSPASASWGMYNNYEERGDDFKKCVESLKRK